MQRYHGVFTLTSIDGRYTFRFSVINGITYGYVFDRKITGQSGLILKLFFPDSLRLKFIDFLNKIKIAEPKKSYPILIHQNQASVPSNAPFSITSRRPEFPIRIIDRNGIHKQWKLIKEGNITKLSYEISKDGKNWKQENVVDVTVQTIKIIIGKDVEGVVFLGLEFMGINNTPYKIKFPIISTFNVEFPDEPKDGSNEYLSALAVESFINFLQNQLPIIQTNSLTPAPDNTQIAPSSNVDFFGETNNDIKPDTAKEQNKKEKSDTNNSTEESTNIDEEIPF